MPVLALGPLVQLSSLNNINKLHLGIVIMALAIGSCIEVLIGSGMLGVGGLLRQIIDSPQN